MALKHHLKGGRLDPTTPLDRGGMVTVVLTATAMALTLRGMLFVPRFPLPLCVLM